MLFEFNTWVVDTLVAGVQRSSFSREWAAVQLANYYVKGKLTELDIAKFETELDEWETLAEQEAIDSVIADEELAEDDV